MELTTSCLIELHESAYHEDLHSHCIHVVLQKPWMIFFCIFLIDNVLANSVNAFCPWQSVYSFLLPTLLPLSRVRNTIVGKTCQMSKEKESTRIDEWPLNNFLDATELSFNEKRQKSSKVFILVINLITSSNMPCLPSFMKINL